MNTNWENELKLEIPQVDKRINSNIQAVRNKLTIINSKKRMGTWFSSGLVASLVVLICIITLLASPWNSANNDNQPAAAIGVSSLKGSIKIASLTPDAFTRDYGKLLKGQFPGLTTALIDSSKLSLDENYRASYDAIIETQKPDLLVIGSDWEYRHFVNQGKLLNLDKYIKRDRIDLTQIIPASLQTLKAKGNGHLFGLAATFDNKSLLYNKSLFDQYHIPYPTDQMSWYDIINLAGKFPQSNKAAERIYGFHEMYMSMYSPVYLINMIANTNGLQFMNEEATKVTMDSEAWNHAFHLAIDGYQSGLFSKPATAAIVNNRLRPTNQGAKDLFGQGKAAMTLDSIAYYTKALTKNLGFNVGIVTAPVAKSLPSTSSFFKNGPIYAVNADAVNPEAAWQVIKYINSEAAAKLKNQTYSGITTHKSELVKFKNPGLEAFYKMDSASSTLFDFPELPQEDFARYFDAIFEEEVAKVMNGKQTVDQAQLNIQAREQINLDKSAAAE